MVALAFLPLEWVLHPLSLLLLLGCAVWLPSSGGLLRPPLGGVAFSLSRVGGAAFPSPFVLCCLPLPPWVALSFPLLLT